MRKDQTQQCSAFGLRCNNRRPVRLMVLVVLQYLLVLLTGVGSWQLC